jgi:S1-C subfamily serine protease
MGKDPFTDVAVIRIDRDGLPAAEFAQEYDLAVGEPAVAIGSPLGYQAAVSCGIISGLGRELSTPFTRDRQQSPLGPDPDRCLPLTGLLGRRPGD